MQDLLPPVDVQIEAGRRQLDGVLDVQGHPTVDHDRIVRTDALSMFPQKLDVILQPHMPLIRTIWQRNLGIPESYLLRSGRLWASDVKRYLGIDRTTNHLVHRLSANLLEQVPYSEVNDGYDRNGEPLPSIEHCRAEHLVPQAARVSWVCANQETFEMLRDDPASGWTAEPSGKPSCAVASFDFDAERAEGVDAPSYTRAAVLLILGHGRGNGIINKPALYMFISSNFFVLSREGLYTPMATGDIVVVTTGTYTSYDKSSNGFDCGKCLDG